MRMPDPLDPTQRAARQGPELAQIVERDRQPWGRAPDLIYMRRSGWFASPGRD